jgi:ribosome-binding factor A
LGNSLQLRYTPELIFVLDKSIERGANIGRILSGLDGLSGEGDEEETDE